MAEKGRPARLARGMRADAAFDAVVGANLAHLRANERGMLRGRDPEYLHQMRVALRRLRSATGIFRYALPQPPAVLRGELRWISRELSAARDWDVFVTQTMPQVEAAIGARLPRLTACCGILRRRAGARARRAVRSGRYGRLVRSLAAGGRARPRGATLVQPLLEDFAPAVLEARYRPLAKAGARPGTLAPRTLHRLRIELKKFRYAAYFFQGLFPRRAERAALGRLSRLQDILGALNDAAVAGELVALALSGARRAGLQDEARQVLAWRRRRIDELRRGLAHDWRRLRAGGCYWRQGG